LPGVQVAVGIKPQQDRIDPGVPDAGQHSDGGAAVTGDADRPIAVCKDLPAKSASGRWMADMRNCLSPSGKSGSLITQSGAARPFSSGSGSSKKKGVRIIRFFIIHVLSKECP